MAAAELPDRWFLDDEIDPRHPVYTRASIDELLPRPLSPLGHTLLWQPGLRQGWRDAALTFMGFGPDEIDADRPEVMIVAGGYPYLSLSIVREFARRAPGLTPARVDAAYFGAAAASFPPIVDPAVPDEVSVVGHRLGWVLDATDLPELRVDREEADATRSGRPDLATFDDADVIARARRLVPACRRMFDRHVMITVASSIGLGALVALGERLGDPSLGRRLVAGFRSTDADSPSWALWDLSRAVRASPELTAELDAGTAGLLARLRASESGDVAAFLDGLADIVRRHGSRGPNDWELATATWESDPTILLAAIDRLRLVADDASPARRQERLAADRAAVLAEVEAALDDEGRAELHRALRSAAVCIPARVQTNTTLVKLIGEVRHAVMELGRRLVDRGQLEHISDITLVTDDELDACVADPAAFAAIIEERRGQLERLASLEPPPVIDGSVPPLPTWPTHASLAGTAAPGLVLTGTGTAPGVAEGRARVIADPAHPEALELGDVLVTDTVGPAWMPLVATAGAVIVDLGSTDGPAGLVARGLGVPCVVGVSGATTSLDDGVRVRVDGTAGTVTVLD
ncbi:MAG: PEP-utilizing enzyme [Actinomycetota bacterium]|nr:PEP-utilizing enzyme [Actinomycetota bacterium]